MFGRKKPDTFLSRDQQIIKFTKSGDKAALARIGAQAVGEKIQAEREIKDLEDPQAHERRKALEYGQLSREVEADALRYLAQEVYKPAIEVLANSAAWQRFAIGKDGVLSLPDVPAGSCMVVRLVNSSLRDQWIEEDGSSGKKEKKKLSPSVIPGDSFYLDVQYAPLDLEGSLSDVLGYSSGERSVMGIHEMDIRREYEQENFIDPHTHQTTQQDICHEFYEEYGFQVFLAVEDLLENQKFQGHLLDMRRELCEQKLDKMEVASVVRLDASGVPQKKLNSAKELLFPAGLERAVIRSRQIIRRDADGKEERVLSVAYSFFPDTLSPIARQMTESRDWQEKMRRRDHANIKRENMLWEKQGSPIRYGLPHTEWHLASSSAEVRQIIDQFEKKGLQRDTE